MHWEGTTSSGRCICQRVKGVGMKRDEAYNGLYKLYIYSTYIYNICLPGLHWGPFWPQKHVFNSRLLLCDAFASSDAELDVVTDMVDIGSQVEVLGVCCYCLILIDRF